MTVLATAGPGAKRAAPFSCDPLVLLLPATGTISAGVSIALVEYKVYRVPHFPFASRVTTMALAGLAVCVLLALALRFVRHRFEWFGTGSGVSWLAALEAGILLLPIPVAL